MERVTFQDEGLAARIRERCVATWRNAVPGFRTASLSAPLMQGTERSLATTAGQYPGNASNNVATVFSTPEGRVLHVAPGLLDAKWLGGELEFALALDDALRQVADDPAEQGRVYALKHALRGVGLGMDVPPRLRTLLQRVHRTLAARPLLSLAELRREDYTDEVLDVEATRLGGLQLLEHVQELEQRAAAPPPKPKRPQRRQSS